jgi:hypothetical protein
MAVHTVGPERRCVDRALSVRKIRIALVAVLALALPLALTAARPAIAAPFQPELLVNGSAEDGLRGWSGSGFEAITYAGSDVPPFPAPFGSDPPYPAGERLFSATGDGAISQVVDLSDRGGTIDSGEQYLTFGALLGGRDAAPGGARLVVQPLDRKHDPLGDPFVLGPPTTRDRQSTTTLMSCFEVSRAPAGTRSVIVRLEAVGQGIADDLFLTPQAVPTSTVLILPPRRPTDAPGCSSYEVVPGYVPPAPPPPALQSVVILPAANRCGRRDPLRFTVKPNWRSHVKTLDVRARRTHAVVPPATTVTVTPSRRRLHVSIRVTLPDGERVSGTRTFSGCRA